MRSSGLTVFAGVAAALCFISVSFNLYIGQFFFPLSTLPFFLVLFLQPHREIWLAFAGSGLTLGILTVSGALGGGTLVGLLLAFVFAAALPALFIGTIYTRPYRYNEDGTPAIWVPAEVPMISLCFLSLILFYTAYAFSPMIVGQTMYELFYDQALGFVKNVQTQLQAMNPNMAQQNFDSEAMATTTTVNMSGIMLFMFIFGQYANLLFAQWILRRRYLIDQPMPYMGNFYFPHQFLLFFSAALGLYIYAHMANWADSTIFALTPLVVAFGLPLTVQGLSTFHRSFVLRLVKLGRISVYLGLFLGLLAMPLPMIIILTITGFVNNMAVYLRKRFA